MIPDATPFADWPAELQTQWNDLAQRHQLDPQRPAVSLREAYNRIADELDRHLAEAIQRNRELVRYRQ